MIRFKSYFQKKYAIIIKQNVKIMINFTLIMFRTVPMMYTERQRCILVEVYKSLNHISPPYLHDMFNVKDLPYGLRNDSIVHCQIIIILNM